MNGIALVAELEVINIFVEVVRAETFLITSALLQLFSQPHRHFQSCPLLCWLISSTSVLGASMFSARRDGFFDTNKDHVHGEVAKAYYARCSSVPRTLLISEATFIAPQAGPEEYAKVPGPAINPPNPPSNCETRGCGRSLVSTSRPTPSLEYCKSYTSLTHNVIILPILKHSNPWISTT